MFKKILLTGTLMMTLVLGMTGMAMAAPDELTGNEISTANLVKISKPGRDLTTYSDRCYISGESQEGVKITIYIKNDNKDTYEKLISDDGEEVSWVVNGPKGVFVGKEIKLKRDTTNRIIIYAEKDNDFEIVTRKISVKTLNLKKILKDKDVKLDQVINSILTN